jgi:hypothetical protein
VAFIVETGFGIPNANSYCTVEFSESYHKMQIDGQGWEDVDLPDKQIRLVTASQMIDANFDFHGRRISRFQGMEFPRWGLRSRDGLMLPVAPLPNFLKCATAELARILGERADAGGSATGSTATSSAGAVEKIQVGPIALTLSSGSTTGSGSTTAASATAPVIPRPVVAWLLDYSIPRFGYGSARLVR